MRQLCDRICPRELHRTFSLSMGPLRWRERSLREQRSIGACRLCHGLGEGLRRDALRGGAVEVDQDSNQPADDVRRDTWQQRPRGRAYLRGQVMRCFKVARLSWPDV